MKWVSNVTSRKWGKICVSNVTSRKWGKICASNVTSMKWVSNFTSRGNTNSTPLPRDKI
jgi:hypothetical protein